LADQRDVIPSIRIETPSAAAAFLLEDRLRLLHPIALLDAGRWWVEVTHPTAGVDEVVANVRDWLDEIDSLSTTVWLDTTRRTVSARDREPLGAGYDGPALDHEP
jgi:hypothetical protein